MHHNKIFKLGQHAALSLAVATALVLGGCGGGGDDEHAGRSPLNTSTYGQQSPSQPAPAPTIEVKASGDATRYVGTWQGECGVFIRDGKNTYLKLRFILSSASTNVVRGLVSETTYTDSSCQSCAFPLPFQEVTLTISGQSATASGTHSGQADRVSLSIANDMPSQYFFGFSSGYDMFWISSDTVFGRRTVGYQKV